MIFDMNDQRRTTLHNQTPSRQDNSQPNSKGLFLPDWTLLNENIADSASLRSSSRLKNSMFHRPLPFLHPRLNNPLYNKGCRHDQHNPIIQQGVWKIQRHFFMFLCNDLYKQCRSLRNSIPKVQSWSLTHWIYLINLWMKQTTFPEPVINRQNN